MYATLLYITECLNPNICWIKWTWIIFFLPFIHANLSFPDSCYSFYNHPSTDTSLTIMITWVRLKQEITKLWVIIKASKNFISQTFKTIIAVFCASEFEVWGSSNVSYTEVYNGQYGMPQGKNGVSSVSSSLKRIAVISHCIFLAILLCI